MSNWKSELNRLSQRKDSTLPDVFFGEVPSNTFNWLNSTILKLREKKIDLSVSQSNLDNIKIISH